MRVKIEKGTGESGGAREKRTPQKVFMGVASVAFFGYQNASFSLGRSHVDFHMMMMGHD